MCEMMDWVIWTMLVICGIRDWRKKEIPVLWLVIFSVVVTVAVLIWGRNMLLSRIVGVLLGVFFIFVSKWTKEAVGFGDSWIILLLGTYLGSLRVFQLLFSASILAGVGGLFILWKHRWKRDVSIPFVPYMALAYLGVIIT